VRGAAAREALAGFPCDVCRRFYTAFNDRAAARGAPPLSAEVLLAAASRHRGHHAPDHTPPGYWDLDADSLPDADDLPVRPRNAHAPARRRGAS